jgi:hypothetical protein
MNLKSDLLNILETSNGERKIHAYLKENPQLIWATFMNCGGHSDYAIPEFSLGSKFRTDFVVMQSFSGGWNIALIELEPVDEDLFNQDGTPTKRLRGAIQQIDNWRRYIDSEKASFCSALADAAMQYDVLDPERNLGMEPFCIKCPLRDPQTYLCASYHIMMGRRKSLDEKSQRIRASYKPYHSIEIATYDRLVQVAENIENGLGFFHR